MNLRTYDEIVSFMRSEISNYIKEIKEDPSRATHRPNIIVDDDLASTLAKFDKGNVSVSLRDLARGLCYYGARPEEIMKFLSHLYVSTHEFKTTPPPE